MPDWNINEIGSSTWVVIRKFLKGAILMIWIVCLVTIGLFASTNSISGIVFKYFNASQYEMSFGFGGRMSERVNPQAELRFFISRYNGNPPPIESVLDEVIQKYRGLKDILVLWERMITKTLNEISTGNFLRKFRKSYLQLHQMRRSI